MKKDIEFDPMAPRPNLDFSKGVRGKYANLLKQGSNIALIAPDLIDTFPDSKSVNDALRSLKKVAMRTAKLAPRRRRSTTARAS